MLESRVENYLKKKVEKLGGKAFKWAPVGVTGVPDRMVLLPGGKIIFVELKAPGKKARKLQEYRAKQLRELGFQVECLDTIERIDRLFTDWSKKNEYNST
ncbi:VRR-NUC domain-containing protein [Clostridium neonatale]|nr:VRR-NUC domain-containing protein [Clostridium neonatale]